MLFSDLHISQDIIEILENKNIKTPTNSQILSFEKISNGENIWLKSPTGSGKTLAYILPIINKLLIDKKPLTQVVFFTPTHELAIQISNFINETFSSIGIKSLALIGKASIDRQKEKLKKKPNIVVGSVGRILELIDQKKLKAAHLQYCIIDEADRMLEDDSLKLLKQIISKTTNLQYILGSATIKNHAFDIASGFIENLELIDDSKEKETIEHSYIIADGNRKTDSLRKLLNKISPSKSIVFLHRNNDVDFVTKKIDKLECGVGSIHGEQNKIDRANTIKKFKIGQIKVLVASDVAARGLDINDVDFVINYDIPSKAEDYQHRAGRTGRMGKSGNSILLIKESEFSYIEKLQKKLGIDIKKF
ncbi:DEAD/DEAH box helicase [Francisella orientalis]|uniref:ATP-dependent RNA helicase n=2 Tax=Francisella orientalis TaxID=299583 RepID=A0AAP7C6B9_9GAMM|nr:DEAD/DEAH box helicase [Francisella orientalis]AFJ43969.1 DEAD-box ATP dependent DNA helicase [Francisella orientalis str. Toba 04]AHB98615.1 DEAD/DEAH box helicase [Francisella orientalis LADL 07-285A]AKN85862.1 ATP-dependent RNA helicase [Francisella orientalis FNO12]AKN87401.1 ATP-dependent RNA helicase [Francisella orientalis FNO24]AKN88938.1 ATP-dependent RNA helicase [Francisella orientalis]